MMDIVCCFVRGDVSVLYLYSQNYNTFDYNLMIIIVIILTVLTPMKAADTIQKLCLKASDYYIKKTQKIDISLKC